MDSTQWRFELAFGTLRLTDHAWQLSTQQYHQSSIKHLVVTQCKIYSIGPNINKNYGYQ